MAAESDRLEFKSLKSQKSRTVKVSKVHTALCVYRAISFVMLFFLNEGNQRDEDGKRQNARSLLFGRQFGFHLFNVWSRHFVRHSWISKLLHGAALKVNCCCPQMQTNGSQIALAFYFLPFPFFSSAVFWLLRGRGETK